MNTSPYVLIAVGADGVATLTMDRPRQLNAISIESCAALSNGLASLAANENIRVVVLRSNGSSFCGGGDLAAMGEHLDALPEFLSAMIDSFHPVILAIRRLSVPVIACVQGAAAGGGFSLAMACDLIVAARSARFVVAYPKLATSSDGGLSHHLSRRLGAARAFEILLLNDKLSAEHAMQLGLVSLLAEDEQLAAKTLEVARQLARLPRQAVAEFKWLLGEAEGDALAAQLARERQAFLRCGATPEMGAAISAFLQKSKPGNQQ